MTAAVLHLADGDLLHDEALVQFLPQFVGPVVEAWYSLLHQRAHGLAEVL